MSPSPILPVKIREGDGLVFLIGSNPDQPDKLSWPALAALAAADAVVHDGDISPETLALVPPRCFVEAIPGDIGRVRKLAGDGWRVVWLVAGDPANSPAKLAEAERLAEAGIAVRTIASPWTSAADSLSPRVGLGNASAPQYLASALTGLAG